MKDYSPNQNKKKLSEIKNVPYYGKSFPFVPWTFKSKVKVSLVFAKIFYKTIGLKSFLCFWLIRVPFNIFRTNKNNIEGLSMMKKSFGSMAKLEWLLLIEIYSYLEKKNDKEFAYQFSKNAIQESSKFMMNDFYQAKRLSEFEDPFEAFWLYHKGMFKNDSNYPSKFIEEKNCKIMLVHDCRNCKIAKLTIPELSPLGCDHDITGYKSIEKLTKMEFRRPQTIAKDSKPCKFMFFREGAAPNNIAIK